ncbi:MAG TPA: carboxypeptidase regulatory-like domain-containing protein [Pyrinomonadaceae bacterium]|nr:carboxypeptidase regulatory-like domain-containing protein [Pyrinomonadaceae bacterium]
MKSRLRIFLALSQVFVCGAAAAGQATSGAISGTVTDSRGAVVVGAEVAVENLETGLRRKASSDDDGFYRVTGLPLGRYELRVDHRGFNSEVRTGLTLTVTQEAVVNLSLEVSPLREALVVSAAGAAVETASPTVSALVDDKEIRDLPLNGRDIAQLILLQPGVVNSRASVQSVNTGRGTRFSVAGSRPSQNLFTLDGTTINDALNNTPGGAQGLLLGVETVKEFRVLVSTYSAEYGRATGGVFVAVTKSGTNELHGSLFEFLRNDAFDARNFFDREKPAFRRNQFGFTAGGPLVKNRTFFFGGYEGLREYKGITRVAIVPDDDARRGILPGGQSAAVDPRSRPILELFPRANGREFGDGTAEFVGTTDRVSDADFFTARVDHELSASDSVFVRYLFDDSSQVLPRNFPEFPNFAVNRKQVVTIEGRKVISPRAVNELRFGFNRSTPSELVPPTTRTLELIAGQDLGEISVAGLTDIGTERTSPKTFVENNFQLADQLFVTLGRHALKAGGSFERFQFNGRSESRTRGQLRFRSLADLLRFRVRDLQGATLDSDFGRGYRQSLLAFYLQDDLRLGRRLTLGLGLRYELVTTPTEADGKVSNLRDIGDRQVTVGGPYFVPSRKNFAPRAGFALDLFGDGRTALRGGFGVFFDQPLFHQYRSPLFRSLPFVNRGRLTQVASLPVPASSFSGVEVATESFQFRLRPSYVMRYGLNLQRELAGTVVSASYAGARGVNLFGQADINTAVPRILPDGREFFPEGSRRRNPAFDQVRAIFQGFSSFHNSLSLGATRRAAGGLHLQAAYTLGKTIDERSGVSGRQEYANGQSRALAPYDRRLDRARSDFDVRHSFTANASYDLPFGGGRRGLGRALAAGWQLNAIVTLSSGLPFTPYVDGDPDRDATEDNTARPDVVPGVSFTPPGGPTPDLWFNPAAFAPPRLGFRGTAGRNILSGPDYKSVDFSVVKNFRAGEARAVQLRAEAFNLFNRANFDLPSNSEEGELIYTFTPASGVRPARFAPAASVGKIFNTVGDSREIQFGVKFIF